MHTSLSDAFHFLVAVLWCSGLSVSVLTLTLGHSPFRDVSVPAWFFCGTHLFQRCSCSGRAQLQARVLLEVNLLRQGVCPVCLYVFSVTSSGVLPRAALQFLPTYPGVSSPCICLHLLLELPLFLKLKQKHYVHLQLRFWLAVDCSHAFCVQAELLLLAQGSWQPLATVTPAVLVASAAERSEPRCTDTASAKLLIFAYGVVLFKVRKIISYLWGGGK